MKKAHRPAALITGGARRIGREVAIALAADGYDIALHCHRSAEDVIRTAKVIRKAGADCEVFQVDLLAGDGALQLLSGARERFPKLNVLVNSASLFKPSGLGVSDIVSLEDHWGIHVRAPWILTAEFARLVSRGTVVNFLDTNVTKNSTVFGAYLLSKKALAELTRMQALKFAPGIRVNAIAPGFILPPEGKGNGFLKKRAAVVPLKRQGAVANVVQAVRFLIQNDYVTGQTIFVDGGEHLT